MKVITEADVKLFLRSRLQVIFPKESKESLEKLEKRALFVVETTVYTLNQILDSVKIGAEKGWPVSDIGLGLEILCANNMGR